jgi:large subunit ribosomal protein L29
MRAKELRDLSLEDLELKRKEFREEIFHLALRRATGQLENPMKVRESRRDLARVETVIRERRASTSQGSTL